MQITVHLFFLLKTDIFCFYLGFGADLQPCRPRKLRLNINDLKNIIKNMCTVSNILYYFCALIFADAKRIFGTVNCLINMNKNNRN